MPMGSHEPSKTGKWTTIPQVDLTTRNSQRHDVDLRHNVLAALGVDLLCQQGNPLIHLPTVLDTQKLPDWRPIGVPKLLLSWGTQDMMKIAIFHREKMNDEDE